MNDLDTLRLEVREIVESVDDDFEFVGRTEITLSLDDWQRVRAELLRLAPRNAELEAKATRDHDWITDLLAENKNAYVELAALKARIAGSSVVKLANYGDPFIVLPDHLTVPNSLKGKTVRLVVEE